MWVFISTILLLAHATVGSSEVESPRDPVSSNEENDSDGTADKAMSEPDVQETIMWNGEKLSLLTNNPKTVDLGKTNLIKTSNSIEELNLRRSEDASRSRNRRFIDEINLLVRIMLKESQSPSIGPWLYSPKKQNCLPSDEGQDLSQEEEETPPFNPWAGKRSVFFSASPRIHRPIRVPFNSWGGKRGDEDVTNESEIVHGKRARLPYNLSDRVARTDGFDVKRLADGGKNGRRVPFNSWGGKRSSYEDFDRGSEDVIGDTQLRSVKENPTNEDLILERVIDKRRMRNENYQIRFNSWGGKRYKNAEELVRFFKVNETDNEYMIGHESSEENSDKEDEEEGNDIHRLRIPNKRNTQGQREAGRFEPWGEKRNWMNEAALLKNDYSGPPPESTGRQVFFPWGG